jgi:DNA-binding FadR family transcriptional regulator
VVRRCVTALRQLALETELGAFIGSEDDLLARFNVSRPTLRQAAALVSQEQLLEARRGVGGGYFATRPTTHAVAQTAAIFLQMHKAGLPEIIVTIAPLHVEMAILAARTMTPQKRDKINAFLESLSKWNVETDEFRVFLRLARAWETILGEASDNPVLALYVRILIDLAATLAPEHDIYLRRPDRMQIFMTRVKALAEAILDEDPDRAALIARRSADASEKLMGAALAPGGEWPESPASGRENDMASGGKG